MSRQGHPVFTTHCEMCMGRSTWDFLQDFYKRVEAAENYARRLERDLHEAQMAACQYRAAHAECEASLAASWKRLNEERLDHRASRETLTIESERHKETLEFLDLVFKEAVRSGEVADNFSRLAEVPNLDTCQAVLKGTLSDQEEFDRGGHVHFSRPANRGGTMANETIQNLPKISPTSRAPGTDYHNPLQQVIESKPEASLRSTRFPGT